MVIDSGSTFTCLADHDLFTEFLSKVEEKVGKDSIETKYYDHCYKEENAKGLEKISLQFGGEGEGGKGIELKRENFFDVYKIEKENNIEEYLCLTVVDGTKKKHEMRVRGRGKNNDEMVHLLGSRAQMNFRVAFDITGEDHKVSFDKQENCGKEEEKREGESLVFQE
ncbi:Xylanase inhibitor, C-terminal [Sesbania bispinosa]|nr:Xylanase inhibitor, C-terminal [Sesbania bispinosa]